MCEGFELGHVAYFIKEFVQEVDYPSTEPCQQFIHTAYKSPTFSKNL